MPGNLEQALLYFVYPGLEPYLNRQIDWCLVDDRADMPDRFPQESFHGQYLTLYCLEFSHHVPPFNQRLVRQAFAYCIDKVGLVQQAWANVQRPARGGIVPPHLPGHSPEIGLPFEPATGRALLEQAGYPGGAGLPPLILAALPGFGTTPAYLQAAWREHLGVEVQVMEALPYETLWERVSQGTVHLALGGWEADYPDPDDMLRFFHSASPFNYRGWQSDQFDQWIDQAAQISQQATRLALYRQADLLAVAQETAVVPLYYWQGYSLLRAGFELEGAGKIIRASALKLKRVRVAE
jgi:ABC-type oligopeptide transport system substrate-binding subunit